MILGAMFAIFVSMLLLIIRGVVGPTAFDRIIAVNSFGTNVVVFIVLLGFYKGTEYFIDIAMTYALINFIATIAILRYFQYRKVEEK